MLKVRLHGTRQELQRYLKVLKTDSKIEVLYESNLYNNKSKSTNKRCYLDITVHDIVETNIELK